MKSQQLVECTTGSQAKEGEGMKMWTTIAWAIKTGG